MAHKHYPGVFPAMMIDAIVTAATKIATNALNNMNLCLTREEFAEAFIEPQHMQQLTEVYDLIGGQSARSMNIVLPSGIDSPDNKRLIATINYYRQPNFLVPNYIDKNIRLHTATGQRVVEWATERRRHGCLVGDGIDALHWLNANCQNAYAFSLVYPALVPIMVRCGDGADNPEENWVVRKGRAVAKLKTFDKLPSLPREVIERVRDTSAFFQALMLTDGSKVNLPDNTCAFLVGIPASSLASATVAMYSRPHVITGEPTRTFI